ncbi:ATP-binding protein [Xenophilus arseniciresistens]|uniref:histidine kinase n=1 Tax=Xenophilus arseniciresistens TaxID=1283306 RepID=A0AAE3T067_9BURK|nr:hybrid sensor histidine kinase/response regulator [Xenophilus arseniciresistens]MDA7417275.1 ATP-binding protein [Xenophilus arseniciresistens]
MEAAQPVPPAGAEPMAARVLREQVAMLYANIGASTLADTLVAWLLGALFWWRLGDPLVGVWLLAHLVQTLRYPVMGAYHRDPQAARRSAHWARVHSRELLMYSIVWGLAPWLLLGGADLPMTTLLMLVMLGLIAGGMAAMSAHWPSTLCFAVPMSLGLASALAWYGDLMHIFLAGCALIYLATSLYFARLQNRLLIEALSGRFEKEALADQLREQMQAVERVSAEKTRFLAAASHDLRQPLHAISLFGTALQQELQSQPGAAIARRLMGAVGTLNASLEAMLDISQLDAGVVHARPQPRPLQPLLRRLGEVFELQARKRGLQLRVRPSALWVHGDEQLLYRLLANLIDNAIKYTPQGGVLVSARARGPQVWVEVYDTGIGIAPEHAALVFNEFYQVDNPGRDRSRGLGVGLSIVKRLSLLLSHPLQLHSRPGRGTRFRLCLPAAAARSQAPETESACPPPAGPLPTRVLVLDDELEVREAMQALMQAFGIAVTLVTDETQARAALDHAQAQGQPFDVLLCDWRLAEGQDGLAAAQRLQALAPGLGLPVLMITGETDAQRLQRVHDSGLPVLFKPVAAHTLMQALAERVPHGLVAPAAAVQPDPEPGF